MRGRLLELLLEEIEDEPVKHLESDRHEKRPREQLLQRGMVVRGPKRCPEPQSRERSDRQRRAGEPNEPRRVSEDDASPIAAINAQDIPVKPRDALSGFVRGGASLHARE